MKKVSTLTLVLTAATLAGAAAQVPTLPGVTAATAEEVGMLPTQKKEKAMKSKIDPDLRNPFAARTQDFDTPVAENTQSEEGRIRAALEDFVVNGIAKSRDGSYSAQLESIILKEGELLPSVLADQVDELRVTKITERLVEITWVGDENAERPRQIAMKIEMEPTVDVQLPKASGKQSTTVALSSGGT